jgi:hypothetical protein
MAYKNGIYRSDAPEEKVLVGPAGKGKLLSCYALNLAASRRYLWLFDAAGVSGALDANLIAGPFPIAADPGAVNINIGPDEIFAFVSGLYVASSTSGSTYTPSTTADLRLTINRTSLVTP